MSAAQLAKAEVVISGQTIAVQFNPVSLQVEITNSINQQGEAGGTNQVSTQSSAKLGLDLLFDTSAAGEDVRNKTRPLRAAVRAPAGAQGSSGSAAPGTGAAFVPPLVTFQWGTFTFSGIAESFRETLDFFSADGVPLRATVAMSLKEQAGEFTALERDNPRGSANTSAFEVPAELRRWRRRGRGRARWRPARRACHRQPERRGQPALFRRRQPVGAVVACSCARRCRSRALRRAFRWVHRPARRLVPVQVRAPAPASAPASACPRRPCASMPAAWARPRRHGSSPPTPAPVLRSTAAHCRVPVPGCARKSAPARR